VSQWRFDIAEPAAAVTDLIPGGAAETPQRKKGHPFETKAR